MKSFIVAAAIGSCCVHGVLSGNRSMGFDFWFEGNSWALKVLHAFVISSVSKRSKIRNVS